ncbi:preprotein translocase subunit SecG [Stieleria sp. JC731]|uniref:preprotein translocase subunit SecG n=1 Tax=Pirellulaceae TaxID=2691357 RepID=UPI001E5415C8|nr:preprotein translocase subunit SecG [Stieleria sp. JC731]MCC9600543.1 preprotein translocase subunit SecG [Stieleria sp. JC731]
MADLFQSAGSLPVNFLPLATLGSAALGWVMFILSMFLILLILVQRGKGGGLAGALGGPGGQSAFGSKAGDTFTVITAVSAIVWGLVCAIAMYTLGVPPVAVADEDLDLDTKPALVSPEAEGGAAGGLSGLEGLGGLEGLDSGLMTDPATPPADDSSESSESESAESSEGDASATTETPSAELTPAAPETETAEEADTSGESEKESE